MSDLFNQCRDQPQWAADEIERLTTAGLTLCKANTKRFGELKRLYAKYKLIEADNERLRAVYDAAKEYIRYPYGTRKQSLEEALADVEVKDE